MDALLRLLMDVTNSTLEGKSYCYVINKIAELLPQIILEVKRLPNDAPEDTFKASITRFLQNADRSNLLQQELDISFSEELIKRSILYYPSILY